MRIQQNQRMSTFMGRLITTKCHAPMGCAVQVHESPNKWLTWAPHSVDRWYLRASNEHYHCHVIFIKKTRTERISDTVHFQHKHTIQPIITTMDAIVKGLQDITHAIRSTTNTNGDDKWKALKQLEHLWCQLHRKRSTFQMILWHLHAITYLQG